MPWTPLEVISSENQIVFWKEIDRLVDEAADEEMPDFPRLNFGRELITFSEEGSSCNTL